jgi:hypothetical protein
MIECSWAWARLMRRWRRYTTRRSRFLGQRDIERLMAARADFQGLLRAGSLQLVTCSRFAEAPALLAPLVPTASIRLEVDAFCSRCGGRTIGVHIRRTDFEFQHLSPTAEFIACMRAEVTADPSTRLFLATDDPSEETHLRAAFGDRVLTRPKQFDRARPEGVRDALIDLLILARTRRIIGGWSSSFSETAAEIGRVERIVIGRRSAV